MVIAIIGILAALVTGAAVSTGDTARRLQAETDITGLYKAYEEYKFKYGAYPTNPKNSNNSIKSDVMEYDLSGKSGLIYVFEKAQIFSFDKSQVDETTNNFCDPWGEPYIWEVKATPPTTGMVGLPIDGSNSKIYIYSYGGGADDDATDWVYKK